MQYILSVYHALKLFPFRQYLPAIFFLGGFLWDALTIGKQVQSSDLIFLTIYLVAAAMILWWLAHHAEKSQEQLNSHLNEGKLLRILPKKWREATPYFLLQFLFGSLLSSLFILYFKSASHAFALVWSLALAATLVGNEFLEHHYKENTVSWTMFGFCAILLLNFLLPSLLGSIHWAWFVISTLSGAGLTHYFYKKSHNQKSKVSMVFATDLNASADPSLNRSQQINHGSTKQHASITPTWIVAGVLMVAYFCDVIPPVPLVRLDAKVGTGLIKVAGDYRINIDHYPWWQPWRLFSEEIHIVAGERVYCVTAVFAPRGLHTMLYHRWQHKQSKNWVTTSRIGFSLNGGRQAGFRGYTYKQNLAAGEWRVTVETEEGHTVSADDFTVVVSPSVGQNTQLNPRKQVSI